MLGDFDVGLYFICYWCLVAVYVVGWYLLWFARVVFVCVELGYCRFNCWTDLLCLYCFGFCWFACVDLRVYLG